MAFGDVGGSITELVITCKTPAEGVILISKGDALRLTGEHEVNNTASQYDAVFWQALAAASGMTLIQFEKMVKQYFKADAGPYEPYVRSRA